MQAVRKTTTERQQTRMQKGWDSVDCGRPDGAGLSHNWETQQVYHKRHIREGGGLHSIAGLCRGAVSGCERLAGGSCGPCFSAHTVYIPTGTEGRPCHSHWSDALGSFTWPCACQQHPFTQDSFASCTFCSSHLGPAPRKGERHPSVTCPHFARLTTCRSQFSPASWVLRIKVGSSGLA